LTDAVLASLAESGVDTSLFTFGTPSDAEALNARTNSGGKKGCKTFPGDAAWPGKEVWKLLNSLSGGRLIATVPSAASCYDSWGVEDEGRCEYVGGEWTDSFFQYVFYLPSPTPSSSLSHEV
jgi:hypothetical protein